MPILIGFFFVSFTFGCSQKSTTNSAENSAVFLILKEGYTCEEVIGKYPEFHFTNPRLISRTENKWSMFWQVEIANRPKALSYLRENNLIISVEEIQEIISPPSNSTNAGHTKTKPIKNK
jgi:hypothetical protein